MISHHVDTTEPIEVGKAGQAPKRVIGVTINAVVNCEHKGALTQRTFELTCSVEDVVVRLVPDKKYEGQTESVAVTAAEKLHAMTVGLVLQLDGGLVDIDVSLPSQQNDAQFYIPLWKQVFGHAFKAFDVSPPQNPKVGEVYNEPNGRVLDFAFSAGAMSGSHYRHTVMPGTEGIHTLAQADGAMIVGSGTLAIHAEGASVWAPGHGLSSHEVLLSGKPTASAVGMMPYFCHVGIWEIQPTDFVMFPSSGETRQLPSSLSWPGYAVRSSEEPAPNRWVEGGPPARGLPRPPSPPPRQGPEEVVEPVLVEGQSRIIFDVRAPYAVLVNGELLEEGMYAFRGAPGPVQFEVVGPDAPLVPTTVELSSGRHTTCVVDSAKATCTTK